GSKLHIRPLTSPRVPYHFPPIAGRRRGVNDDHTQGAPPHGLLVLVGPTPVVSERTPSEEFGVGRGGLVRKEHKNLSLDVGPFEIVPLVFRRDDSVTHKNGVSFDVSR